MKKLEGKPFALLGVHVGGLNVSQLKAFMTKENLTWRSFVDLGQAGAGPIAKQWNLSATPSFYLLDHKGIIRHKWAGPPGEEALDKAIEVLVREAEGATSRPGK